jgi:hypothetical protein
VLKRLTFGFFESFFSINLEKWFSQLGISRESIGAIFRTVSTLKSSVESFSPLSLICTS